MKFSARIDLFNIVMIVLTIGILALPLLVFDFSWIYLVVMLAFDALYLTFILSTRYELNDDGIIIQSRLIKIKINYDQIKRIELVKVYWRSSCANSVGCVEIMYGNNPDKPFRINISPKKENEFLESLQLKCPDIRILSKRG